MATIDMTARGQGTPMLLVKHVSDTGRTSLTPEEEIDVLDELLARGESTVLESLFERKAEDAATADLVGFVWDVADASLDAVLLEGWDLNELAQARADGEIILEAGTMRRTELANLIKRRAPEVARALGVTSREDVFPCVVMAFGRVTLRFLKTNLWRWTAGGVA